MVQQTQPCPGICEIRAIYEADGQTIENVYHVRKDALTKWTTGELDAMATTFSNWHIANVIPLLSTAITLTEVILTDLTDLTGLRNVYAQEINNVGTHNNPMLPLSVTKALEWFTGNRGRGVNGHLYWPSFTEDQVTNDGVLDAIMDDVKNALSAWLGEMVGLPGFTAVVLSRYLGGVKRASGVGRPIIDVTSPNNDVSVQKNRLPFHKRHKRRVVTV